MAELPKGPSGVQELIGRLREDGVKAGRAEAERIEGEGRKQAEEIVARARAEADELLAGARIQIETERKAAHDAVRMAYRDTSLKLAADVKSAFSEHLKKLVSGELGDREFLRSVLLAIFGKAVAGVAAGQPVEVLLPENLFTDDGKLPRLTDAGKGHLRKLVLGVTADMLRDGVTLKPSGEKSGGIRVRLVGQDLEIDLSDEAVSELMLGYLLPRYRAIVEGVD